MEKLWEVNNICRVITIKNKTNSSRQWDFSCELEHNLHYKVLIAANKDPGFIDPLPEKNEGMGQWTALMNKPPTGTSALANTNYTRLKFEKSPKEEEKLAILQPLMSPNDREDTWNAHQLLNNDWHAASQGRVFLFIFPSLSSRTSRFEYEESRLWLLNYSAMVQTLTETSYTSKNKKDLNAGDSCLQTASLQFGDHSESSHFTLNILFKSHYAAKCSWDAPLQVFTCTSAEVIVIILCVWVFYFLTSLADCLKTL